MAVYFFVVVFVFSSISLQFADGKSQGSVMFCVSALNYFLSHSLAVEASVFADINGCNSSS